MKTLHGKMEYLKIEHTDIFLDDQGNGRGKIIISNTSGYNFSYYWGSMGSSLKEFLCDIDSGYFINKLCRNDSVFCGRSTVKAIRKLIKTDYSWELPWYKHMEFQKELRVKIKDLENCSSNDEFVHIALNIPDSLDYYLIEDKYDRKDIEGVMKSIFSEPWYMIETKPSDEARFLESLHKKLRKVLISKTVKESVPVS